ncbi:hypothetical protein MSMTP_2330 [Methanosarcina sp. MTP4]|uniref:hypothetical protein n=1 Tax=Methanosarcina sp. MTP4 TaxID=1434100 RepID=UPI0006154EBB|nr:hypothetical protein [Methanosarcina sp. MTP4]AKB25799.1 hypothetical protein MSMTP_2330 [Methanosarcina sp. MTP4]
MKQEAQVLGINKVPARKKDGLQAQGTWGKFSPASSPVHSSFPASFPLSAASYPAPVPSPSPFSYISAASFPVPDYPAFPSGLPSLDLNIYREPHIKALIKEQSRDLYRLIKKVHFDGRYYRVKCVRSGAWEHCWELAVRVQFFGMMQGLAVEPERVVSAKSRKIIYRSLILVNPYELWDEELVERLWNLQERIEFLISKILFHECIHVLIFLGKSLPAGFGQTDIFLEFRELLELAKSEQFYVERQEVLHCLRNLTRLSLSLPENHGKIPEHGTDPEPEPEPDPKPEPEPVHELYEFLVHEKYSIKKTDLAFGLSWSNGKISRDYAKIAALKFGSCLPSDKKLWDTEVRRLRRALKKLYDRLDEEQHSRQPD